ncbi:hypothetical protein L9F63_018396 [Diploptera punctata]|uniref:Myb/SANT-like DNA-binding domain-containing protein n=1 Tax=Diploptera punctata TaxID=6984 RepID=A0AAD7ZWW9_DIPPU|nr:hypothetical protein L9F63_018396 [Diploptera punctata]
MFALFTNQSSKHVIEIFECVLVPNLQYCNRYSLLGIYWIKKEYMMSAGTSDTVKTTVWRSHLDKPGATIALIRKVGSERIQSKLLDRNTIKKSVWAQIAQELIEEGFDLGPDGGKACHQKWRNLKRAYIVYVTKPGNKNPPPYMEELQKALETTRNLIKPLKCEDVEMDSRSDDLPSDNDGDSTFSPLKSAIQFSSQSVNLAEVLAIVHNLDQERRSREEAREKREEERFRRIEALLKEQAEQTEKLTNTLLAITQTLASSRKRKLSESNLET